AGMAELAVLEVVGSEPEAEIVLSLLRSEGIKAIAQKTNYAVGLADAASSAARPPCAERNPRGGGRGWETAAADLVLRGAVEQGQVGRERGFGQADEPLV